MSDAVIFVAFFGGIFVLRIIAATVVFFWLLPAGDRCPHCDAATFWIRKPTMNRLLPWLRTSWCPECNWDGMLRHGRLLYVVRNRDNLIDLTQTSPTTPMTNLRQYMRRGGGVARMEGVGPLTREQVVDRILSLNPTATTGSGAIAGRWTVWRRDWCSTCRPMPKPSHPNQPPPTRHSESTTNPIRAGSSVRS